MKTKASVSSPRAKQTKKSAASTTKLAKATLFKRNPDFFKDPEPTAADLREIPPLTDAQLAAMIPMSEWKKQRKEQITLRLDPEVLAYFRATGDGYQSRISEALRRFVAAQKSIGQH